MSLADSSSRNFFFPASDDPPEPTNQLDTSINRESDQESGQACIVPGPELRSVQDHSKRDVASQPQTNSENDPLTRHGAVFQSPLFQLFCRHSDGDERATPQPVLAVANFFWQRILASPTLDGKSRDEPAGRAPLLKAWSWRTYAPSTD